MKTDGKHYAYKFARERILEAGFAYVLPPAPLAPFRMLRKTEELSPSLLWEASFCGVKVSVAGEMDSTFKKSPNDST